MDINIIHNAEIMLVQYEIRFTVHFSIIIMHHRHHIIIKVSGDALYPFSHKNVANLHTFRNVIKLAQL